MRSYSLPKIFYISPILFIFLISQSLVAKTGKEPLPKVKTKISKKRKARVEQENTLTSNESNLEFQETVLTSMGFGKGLSFETVDKQNFLNMRVRFQERATETLRSEEGEKPKDEFELQTRRARLVFSGNFLGKFWQYYIQLSFSNLDMEEDRPVPLRDASLSYTRFNNANIKIGQMKVPFNRQRFISDGLQEFVDRTVANEELNLDRDVGVLVSSTNLFGWNCLGYSAGIFGGDGRNRTSNASGALTSGKLTYYPLGTFADNGEPDLEHTEKPKLSISIAGANNRNTNRELSTHGDTYQFARFDYTHTGAEFLFQWKGFSASGEYMTRKANSPFEEKVIVSQTLTEYSRSVKGGFFQVGYLFKNNLGLALRYSEYKPWGKTDPKLTFSRERGVALSYYLKDHNLKFQADYAYLEGGYVDNIGSHRIRAQIQVFL
ncbi:porin [Leptospira sarikeiensis]|uniref:Porin n=1 Tax=Leptospira sarikeiensis TaxID=2484943 RepID=A0A4R9K0V7_9LEPT|nr:porin [Leptospira sarikeiensis]TGL58751.1 porin [Leptospira sarikeiensis]